METGQKQKRVFAVFKESVIVALPSLFFMGEREECIRLNLLLNDFLGAL